MGENLSCCIWYIIAMPYKENMHYDSANRKLWVDGIGLDFELIKAVYFAMIPIVHPEVDLEAEIKRYNG